MMNELIMGIMNSIDKKGIQKNCKRILKKCSIKSAKDTGLTTELAIWLYIFGYDDEAIAVCELFKDIEFNGNYTLWDNIDHAYCLKARILRKQGKLEESKNIIEHVNEYRQPSLYPNTV